MKESTMTVNSFNEPLDYKNRDAIALLLLRLLLLEPGTNNSHPEMGVGIVSKYRFSMDDDLEELKTDIKNQIATYLPEFIVHNVDLVLKNKILYITIQVNEEYYAFELNEQTQILTIGQLRNG